MNPHSDSFNNIWFGEAKQISIGFSATCTDMYVHFSVFWLKPNYVLASLKTFYEILQAAK